MAGRVLDTRSVHFDEFRLGAGFTTASRTITSDDERALASLTGDFNPLHLDDLRSQYGRESRTAC